MLTARIQLDVSGLRAQLEQLHTLLASIPEGRGQAIRARASSYLECMEPDVLLGEKVTADAADGSCVVVYSPLLGSDFENLVAALRAGEVDDI